MNRLGLFLVSFVLIWVNASSGLAQERAGDYLPAPELLGDGWVAVADVPIADELSPAFSEVAGRVYAGPEGARSVILVYQVAEGMTAIRESWQITNEVFDAYRFDFDTEYDFSREDDVAASRSIPVGCADTRRTYGVEEIGYGAYDVGLTLCASDPDVLVLVYRSGTDLVSPYSDASDDFVEIVLTGSTTTPTP